MGRKLSPEELEVFEKERRKQIEEEAARLGISADKLYSLHSAAISAAHHECSTEEKERLAETVRAAFKAVGDRFFDSLKTDSYRAVFESGADINGMSDDDFTAFVARKISILDPEERAEAERVTSRIIESWDDAQTSPVSLREEIMLNIEGMIKSHDYRAQNN